MLLTLLILLSFFRNPDLLHRLMGESLWNFHLGIPTNDPPLFKNLVFADGIVRFAGGEPTEEAKAIFAFIPKLRRTFLSTLPAPEPLRQATTTSFSTPTASPSTAGTIRERTPPPSAKPMWRKIDPMKNRMHLNKVWTALPLFLGALSFLSFALYFYSANHAPYSYTNCILAGPVFSLIGMIFSFLTRKSRKAYPNLWICGLIACSLGFILCALILAILIFFLAATVTGGL